MKEATLTSLVDAHLVVDRQKIVGYLLSDSHPIGRYKYRYFVRFGFRAAEWATLRDALLAHAVANDVIIDRFSQSLNGRNVVVAQLRLRPVEKADTESLH